MVLPFSYEQVEEETWSICGRLKKYGQNFYMGLSAVCALTVQINMAFPLPSPQKSLENGSLKKNASRILFLNIKKTFFVFPLWKGNWKLTASWRLGQLNQTNPHTSPVGNSFSSFGSQIWSQPAAWRNPARKTATVPYIDAGKSAFRSLPSTP